MKAVGHSISGIIIPLFCGILVVCFPSQAAAQTSAVSQRVTMGTDLSIYGYASTVETPYGDLAAAGSYASSIFRNYPLVSLFSKNGNLQWSLKLGLGEAPERFVGGVTAMHTATSGDLLVAGWVNTNKNLDIQFPYEDAFLAKISASGAVSWIWRFDRNRTSCVRENYFRPFLLTELPDGDIFLAADYFDCLDESKRLVMMRLAPEGSLKWSSTYEGSLSLALRGGVDARNGLISFWGRGPGTGSGGVLEKFEVDPQTGRILAYKTWAIDPQFDQPNHLFSGENVRSQVLPNGHTLVTGVSADAYGLKNTRPVIFSALEFDAQDVFLKGFHIIPAQPDSGTISLNIKPALDGSVVMQRTLKLSAERTTTDLAVFRDGQWLSQRRFLDMPLGLETPDPVHLFTDGTFALLNQFQGVVDYYFLQSQDRSSGCLGNTDPGFPLFAHRPAFYRPISSSLPRLVADTITGVSVASESVLQAFQVGNRFNLGPDQAICEGNNATLAAPYGFEQYLWSNGQRDRVITVSAPGVYSCRVTDACGQVFTDSVEVKSARLVNLILERQVAICPGEELQITALGTFREYRWGPDYEISSNLGSPELRARPLKDTAYYLEARDPSGCSVYDTVKVRISKPIAFSLAGETIICPGDRLVLSGPAGMSNYLWSDGSTGKDLEVRKKGTYSLTVLNADRCPSSASLTVLAGDCPTAFFMPNAFTPNGDGLNDQIRPVIRGDLAQYRFSIYNRWGQLVFSTMDPDVGWDGRLAGQQQPGQVFTWKCQWQMEGGEPQAKMGTVVLIR
jgi:gliding motility-associated-like protein